MGPISLVALLLMTVVAVGYLIRRRNRLKRS
jgi:hypothetical protein